MTSTTPTPAEVAATIRKAADELELAGMCRHAYADDAGRVCALGALQLVLFGSIDRNLDMLAPAHPLWQASVDVLSKHARATAAAGEVGDVADYNDEAATDTADMVAVMRAAADEHERREVAS